MSVSDLDIIRKRLKWRATHRGIKEMDILVGGYAQTHLGAMTAEELEQFAEILEMPDQDLLSWATKQGPIPSHQDSPMLQSVLEFRPEGLK